MTNTKKHKKALAHLKNVDPVIYEIAKTINYDEWFKPWERMHSIKDYFKSLCGIIIGQQLSTKAADTIFARFEILFNRNPTPKKVFEKDDLDLRGVGLSNSKVKYVKDLAQKILSKELDLESLPNLSDEEIIVELTKVKGIGTWSAEMFLIFNLGRENVFSDKDLGLLHGIEKIYYIKSPDKDTILQIVNKWTPFKSYGSIALWHSLTDK